MCGVYRVRSREAGVAHWFVTPLLYCLPHVSAIGQCADVMARGLGLTDKQIEEKITNLAKSS